jgi:hypothetical protein
MTSFVGMSMSGPLGQKLRAMDGERKRKLRLAAKRRHAEEVAAIEAAEIERERIIAAVVGIERRRPKKLTGAAIMREVAAKYGITIDTLNSKGRHRALVWVRQEAMFRMAAETPLSMTAMGRLFDMDHTSIMHGIDRYVERNELLHPRKPRGVDNAEAKLNNDEQPDQGA